MDRQRGRKPKYSPARPCVHFLDQLAALRSKLLSRLASQQWVAPAARCGALLIIEILFFLRLAGYSRVELPIYII